MQFAFILLAIVACLAGFVILMVHIGFRAPRIRETGTPQQFQLDYAEVDIPARQGAHLFGWLLPVKDSTKTIILLHGWGGNAEMMLPLARPFIAAGINVLLIDSRNHGRSDRGAISSMPRFAEDADSAIDYLQKNHHDMAQKIALLGHSVGAGAVLLAASRRKDINAVISISAFAHPDRMMRRFLAGKRIPRPIISAILNYVQWIIGARFEQIAPMHTICRQSCPVLLVHGKADSTIPVDDARDILRNCPDRAVELVEIDGADHDSVELIEQHAHQLTDFLRRNAF